MPGLAAYPKVTSAIEHQINRWLVDDHIFYNVPIVATTAQLFRLNEGVRIQEIRSATEIEEVATQEPCLVMQYSPGADLHRYNTRIFNEFLAAVDHRKLKSSLHSHTKDLSHFFSVLAQHYCPRAIVFITVDEAQGGFEKLFGYVDQLLHPDKQLLEDLEKQQKQYEELVASFPTDLLKRSKERSGKRKS